MQAGLHCEASKSSLVLISRIYKAISVLLFHVTVARPTFLSLMVG